MKENDAVNLSTTSDPDTRNQRSDLLARLAKTKSHAEEIHLLMALLGYASEKNVIEVKPA